MASGEHLKLLVKSHFEGEERFRTVAIQIAAYEASKGHASIAKEIKKILDNNQFSKNKNSAVMNTDLIISTIPHISMSNLVLSSNTKNRLEKIIIEFKQQDKLKKYGLDNRRKILLCGNPGTGKTMTASVLASSLNLPLCTIMLDKMVTKYMGETSSKLRQIFDTITEFPGVYLFDEFDAIGSERTKDNDIGEIRRVLNSFLQFIEQDNSNSIIIAATNNSQMLDQALFRRFDDIINYELPSEKEIVVLLKNKLNQFVSNDFKYDQVSQACKSLSQAEITKVCNDFIKESILASENKFNEDCIFEIIGERQKSHIR